MGQIVQKANNPVRCNLAAIQSGGSKAGTVLASGEIWLVDTTNASKGSKGYGKYDAYIKGDGVTAASGLDVVMIDAEAFAAIESLRSSTSIGIQTAMAAVSAEQQRATQVENTKYSKPAGGIPKADLASDVRNALDLATDVVYDISAHNNNTAYADLAAALGTNGANIPQSLRKGGMSVRFVLSSDNKYVQYRLMSDAFSATPADWQGVDEEPTTGSENLVKSGGVYNGLDSINRKIDDISVNYGTDIEESIEITDDNSNYIGHADTTGIHAKELYIQPNKETKGQAVSEKLDLLNVDEFYGDACIEITDDNNEYVTFVDDDGIHTKELFIQPDKEIGGKPIREIVSMFDVSDNVYDDEEISITDNQDNEILTVSEKGVFVDGNKKVHPFDKREDRTYKEGDKSDAPLASIKESMGLLPMFENWGFIGDSLSSGFISVPNVGGESPLLDTDETLGRNIYPLSWGQLICKMCGSKGANYSVGGATTRSWLSTFGTEAQTGSGYSDGSRGADFSVKRDVYTIMLGVNDAMHDIPVGNINTDVDLSDYHNNADTYAGNYARIIAMIKEKVPSAKVFCITPYNDWGASVEANGYNAIVRQLVTMFDKTYLVDLCTYGGALKDNYVYTGHATSQGYVYTAYVIANYIDYIIRKYPEDFIFQGAVSRLINDNGNY